MMLSKSKNEERLQNILQNIRDGYFELDLAGNLIFFNDSVCRILGYSREELMGMNYRHYTDKHTRKKIFQAYNKVYRTGEPDEGVDWLIIRKDGTRRYIEASVSLMTDMPGRSVGFRSIVRDITERKQMAERYRSLFEYAQEGIYQSTPGGRFIIANQSMARILGYDSPADLIAGVTNIAGQLYVDPEERARVFEIIEQQGFAKNREVQFRKKDGSVIWVSRTMHAVRDENGRARYYEGIIEDITDRKESVDRLRKALEQTVRAIASIVETRDPYTAGHQRRVADLACAIAREMGLSHDRIEGLRVAATIHDIGKISIPAGILSKPSKLTEHEFGILQTHPEKGYEILKEIDFPWPVARIVREHHERLNGTGYPGNLKGDGILMESYIMSVADVVEAMATHRPYRAALGMAAALEEIEKNRGALYHEGVVDVCLRLFREKEYQLI
ncbi:MAG: PAS domain S-box protein [Thermodesulfobacteriota bacterium]